MKVTTGLIIFLFSSVAHAYGPLYFHPCNRITAAQVVEKIKTIGAQQYIVSSKPNTENSEWECVTDNISSGNPDWLKLASMIGPYTDAGSADDISVALGIALPRNTIGVLGVLDNTKRPISEDEVCTLPFFEGSEADINLYIVKTIRELYKTPGGEHCLSALIKTIGTSDDKNFYEVN